MDTLELYRKALLILEENSTPVDWEFREEGNLKILAYNGDIIVQGPRVTQMIETCKRIIRILERIDNGRS